MDESGSGISGVDSVLVSEIRLELDKLRAEFSEARRIFEGIATSAQTSSKKSKDAFSSVGRSGRAAGSEVADGMSKAEVSVDKLTKKSKGLADEIKAAAGAGSLMKNIAVGFAGGQLIAQTGRALREFIGYTVEATIKLEKLKLSYEGVFGSKAAGQANFDYIYDFSQKFGQDLVSSADAYRKFAVAAELVGMRGEMVKEIYTNVSAALTKAGSSAKGTEGALRALTQMVSKGTVNSEEYRQQFAEWVPGAMKMGADAMGMSVGRFMKAMRDGQVVADEFLPKLSKELEKFSKGWEVSAAALENDIQRLKNEWLLLLEAITPKRAIKWVVQITYEGFKEVREKLEQNDRINALKDLLAAGRLTESDLASAGITKTTGMGGYTKFEASGITEQDRAKQYDAAIAKGNSYVKVLNEVMKLEAERLVAANKLVEAQKTPAGGWQLSDIFAR